MNWEIFKTSAQFFFHWSSKKVLVKKASEVQVSAEPVARNLRQKSQRSLWKFFQLLKPLQPLNPSKSSPTCYLQGGGGPASYVPPPFTTFKSRHMLQNNKQWPRFTKWGSGWRLFTVGRSVRQNCSHFAAFDSELRIRRLLIYPSWKASWRRISAMEKPSSTIFFLQPRKCRKLIKDCCMD